MAAHLLVLVGLSTDILEPLGDSLEPLYAPAGPYQLLRAGAPALRGRPNLLFSSFFMPSDGPFNIVFIGRGSFQNRLEVRFNAR